MTRNLFKEKTADFVQNQRFFGTAEGIRTPDLLVRSQSLYPTELQPHTVTSIPLEQLHYYSTPDLKKQEEIYNLLVYFSFCLCVACASFWTVVK